MAETARTAPRDAFEALARQAIPRLYGLARRLAADGAEDLVQECLLRAYRSFDTSSTPGPVCDGCRPSS